MNLDTDLIPFTKINLQWRTDPNIKCKTIKLLEDNIGENLDGLGFGNDFLDKHQRHIHKRKNWWTSLKLKISALQKTLSRIERQPKDWERIFAKHISDKGLLSTIYKEPLKFKNKKMNNLI